MPKVHGQILANSDNLGTIINHCTSGIMRTEELAEFVGNSEIGEIDPEKTMFISMTDHDGFLKFKFVVNNTESI